MEKKNEQTDGNIYDICVLIHNFVKMDVEYIDANNKSSFQLLFSDVPYTLKASRNETNLFMYDYLKDKHPNDYVYYTDSFQLNFLGIGLWKNNIYSGTIIVGPFLSNIPNEMFFSTITNLNQLQLEHKMQLRQYYKSITLLNAQEYKNIGYLIVNLVINPPINANALFPESNNLFNKKDDNELETEEFYSKIEVLYKLEKRILHAVQRGLKEEALKLMYYFQNDFNYRVPNNPLRVSKNISLSFNTILRLAAERGGVSAVFIHDLSDKFAVLIEKASNISDLEGIEVKMISEYCDLVKGQSTAGYSPIIRKSMNYINLNFHCSLSLDTIAEKVQISPFHLSRQFKKETNLTITEFINRKRISEAKFLIEHSNYSITDIALMVGFENISYFGAVFKKITNYTPREYLNKTRS